MIKAKLLVRILFFLCVYNRILSIHIELDTKMIQTVELI